MHVLLCALLLVLLPTAAVLAEPPRAEVPYAVLHEALQPRVDLAEYPQLEAVARVQSHDPRVRPETIRLRIQARSGVIELAPDAAGRIQLPAMPGLLQENPMVLSNQPRGTLELSVDVALVLPAGPRDRIDPGTLLAAIEQAEQMLRALDEQPPRVSGAELWFDGEASLNLPGPGGERLLISNRERRIVVHKSQLELAGSQPLTLSHPVLLVLPLIEPDRS